jgi:hypothetical protein
MSVSSSTSRVQYNCSGTTAYPFTFGVGETSEVQVIRTATTGVETVLTESTHYAVSAVNSDYSSGGTVTTVATYTDGTITILRNVPLTQESDFTEGMPTLYETFEDGLDKLTRIAQQQKEMIDRVPMVAKSTSASGITLMEGPGKYLRWDDAGTGIIALESITPDDTVYSYAKADYPSGIDFTGIDTSKFPIRQIFFGFSAGDITGMKEARPEWWGGNSDNSTNNTIPIACALAAGDQLLLGKGTYKHTGISVLSNKSIVGLGIGTSVLDYTAATGNGITLSATAGYHRRSFLRDFALSCSGESIGWGITSEGYQIDIGISNVWVHDFDNGIDLIYPVQARLSSPRVEGNGKAKSGSIGIRLGTTPNSGLNAYLESPYVDSFETDYVVYGYNHVLEKPIWETCITGVKNYGRLSIYSPYADADTDDVYTYDNSSYGKTTMFGYVNQGGGSKLTYETTAVQDRCVIFPSDLASTQTVRLGPHVYGPTNITSNTKIVSYLNSSAQTINDDTWTKIALNADAIDQLGESATGTVTIAKEGYYLIYGQIQWATPADGKRLGVAIYKGSSAIAQNEIISAVGSAYPTANITQFVALTVGDTIELWGWQKTGGALNANYGAINTYLIVLRIL